MFNEIVITYKYIQIESFELTCVSFVVSPMRRVSQGLCARTAVAAAAAALECVPASPVDHRGIVNRRMHFERSKRRDCDNGSDD